MKIFLFNANANILMTKPGKMRLEIIMQISQHFFLKKFNMQEKIDTSEVSDWL